MEAHGTTSIIRPCTLGFRLGEHLGSGYVHVGDQSTKIKQKWYAYFYQWRSDPFSTTKLAAWFPLLVTLYWTSMIVLASKSIIHQG
jgi:hypothetical protein